MGNCCHGWTWDYGLRATLDTFRTAGYVLGPDVPNKPRCRVRFRALAVTLMSVLTVAVAPSAQAQLIYDNGAPDWLDGNEMTQWIQAEDFTLTGAATVVGVRFWAISNVGDAWAGSAWYQFYSNSGGVPGALLASGSFVPTFASITCGFSGCFQLDFDLGAGLPLGPGTYFLGLHNGDLSETGRREFYWATTGPNASGTGQEDEAPFGTGGWFDNGQQHAFQLYGGESTVPEPATMLLLATGLVGLGAARMLRRRR